MLYNFTVFAHADEETSSANISKICMQQIHNTELDWIMVARDFLTWSQSTCLNFKPGAQISHWCSDNHFWRNKTCQSLKISQWLKLKHHLSVKRTWHGWPWFIYGPSKVSWLSNEQTLQHCEAGKWSQRQTCKTYSYDKLAALYHLRSSASC